MCQDKYSIPGFSEPELREMARDALRQVRDYKPAKQLVEERKSISRQIRAFKSLEDERMTPEFIEWAEKSMTVHTCAFALMQMWKGWQESEKNGGNSFVRGIDAYCRGYNAYSYSRQNK